MASQRDMGCPSNVTRFPAVGQTAHDFKLSRRARCFDCHIRPHGSNVSEDLTQ